MRAQGEGRARARLGDLAGRIEATADRLAAGIGGPARDRDEVELGRLAEELAALRGPLQAVLRRVEAEDGADPVTKAARAALRAWPGVAAGTAEALAGRPVALFAESPPGTPARRLLTALSRGFEVLDAALAPIEQDAAARAHGCFPDIRLRPITFLRHVHGARRVLAALGRAGEARFLDVGCGAGAKVVLAAAFFARAEGLELDPGYLGVAGRLLGTRHAPRTGLLAGDALAFEAYADYDAIYFYQPMRDDTKLAALERRIAGSAAPGTVLIAPYESFAQRAADLPVAPLAGWLWVAGFAREAAEALRRAAERTGLALPDPGRPPPRKGLLGPLAEALRRAGHLE